MKETSILAGRRLASLASGQVALVPPMTQAGDIIYRLDTGLGEHMYQADIRKKIGWESTFVFRPLDRKVARNPIRLSVSQQQDLRDFRFNKILYYLGVYTVSEEYQNVLLLGGTRVFEDGGPIETNSLSRYIQLLVIH